MAQNLLPRYFELLREAMQASEDVDNFDLRSEDPASVKTFNMLTKIQAGCSIALLAYMREHYRTLVDQLHAAAKPV